LDVGASRAVALVQWMGVPFPSFQVSRSPRSPIARKPFANHSLEYPFLPVAYAPIPSEACDHPCLPKIEGPEMRGCAHETRMEGCGHSAPT